MRPVAIFAVTLMGYLSCFAVQAQDVTKSCDVECLGQKINALERTVSELQSLI